MNYKEVIEKQIKLLEDLQKENETSLTEKIRISETIVRLCDDISTIEHRGMNCGMNYGMAREVEKKEAEPENEVQPVIKDGMAKEYLIP